jgi:hypothetical protein
MKISIVGNAPVVKKVGHIIDESDIIVRFNKFELYGVEKYIGTRTTHAVFGFGSFGIYLLSDTPKDLGDEIEVIYLATMHNKINNGVLLNPRVKKLPLLSMYPLPELQQLFMTHKEKTHDENIKETNGLRALFYFMRLCRRNPIQLVGFGSRDITRRGRMYKPVDDWDKIWIKKRLPHDFIFERKIINELEKEGRVIRLENGLDEK